jgi:aminoglycoside phosphotransferase (APT) family kinase protein
MDDSAPTVGAKQRVLDAPNLQAYLDHLWGSNASTVLNLERFVRGISRETWGVDIRNNDGDPHRPTKLILRRDLFSRSYVPRSLRFEHDVYERLSKTEVPVARPLVYESNPQWRFDGRDFFLRERIEGSWNVPHAVDDDPIYDAHRIALSKEMIDKLALVHSVDWRALDFQKFLEVPSTLEDCAARAIRETYRDLASFQFAPMPALSEVREWMLDNAPVAPRIVLLKGTNGLGEEVFRDGKIVALSDWEQCSLGDPAQDFARTQDLIPEIVRDGRSIWGMQQALEYYRSLTGIKVNAEAVDYYRLLSCIEGVVAFHHALVAVADGSEPSVRRCYYSIELTHLFNRRLLDATLGRSAAPGNAFGTRHASAGDTIVATDD